MSKEEVMQYVNLFFTIVLIVIIGLSVNQRFFENKKCEKWVENKLFEIQDKEGSVKTCTLNCSTGIDINSLTDKSANSNEIKLIGNRNVTLW